MTGRGPGTGTDGDPTLFLPKENALPAALGESGLESGIEGVGML